jgi:FAD:protein FMN transferase
VWENRSLAPVSPLSPLSPPSSSARILFPLLALCTAVCAQAPGEFRFAREDVLGSSSSLVVTAPNEAAARRAEEAVFGEVARLRAVLSTWDAESELSRLIAAHGGKPSTDLTTALQLAAKWRTASHGAFEPGAAKLALAWSEAEKSGKSPDEQELAAAVATLKTPAWTLTNGQLVVRAPFTLDGMAKGHIIDLASRMVAEIPGVDLVSFQIGGDTRLGKAAQEIALVDPRHPAANAGMLMTLRLANGAVASSGGYARGFDLAGVHHSHILDPRTGQPCDNVLGASVVAKDVATADALATTLCVLGPAEGLKMVASMPGTEAVIVTADGQVHESRGMHALVVATPDDNAPQANTNWPKDFALQVDFEIKAPANSPGRGRGGWKRPYVAVWIEDLTGTPARTLCLWGDERRWLRELRRWSRQNAETPRLVELVSQATRKAGNYTLTWDGTDDEGRALVPGHYTVIIEASREHGSYQLMRKEVELGQKAFHEEFEDNEEIGKAKITFGKAGKKGS